MVTPYDDEMTTTLNADTRAVAVADANETSPQDTDAVKVRPTVSASSIVVPLYLIALAIIMAALILGKGVFLPFATATLISLALKPIVVALNTRAGIPRPLSALALVLILAALLLLVLYSLSGPAKEWLDEAPRALQALEMELAGTDTPIDDLRATSEAISQLGSAGEDTETEVVIAKSESSVEQTMMAKTGQWVSTLGMTLAMVFFILGWGERVFHNAVGLAPRFREKKNLLEVFTAIESAVARYLLTMTVINSTMGLVVAGITYFCGLPNPALWGVVAAALHFMPYIGALFTFLIVLGVSVISQPVGVHPLLAPLIFAVVTIIEGYVVTPYAVGRSLTLNPLVIFLSLVLTFAVWGAVGALLAVPMLACIKVALETYGEPSAKIARILS